MGPYDANDPNIFMKPSDYAQRLAAAGQIGSGGPFPGQSQSQPGVEVSAVWEGQDDQGRLHTYQHLYFVNGSDEAAAIGAIVQKHVSPRQRLVAIAAGRRSG